MSDNITLLNEVEVSNGFATRRLIHSCSRNEAEGRGPRAGMFQSKGCKSITDQDFIQQWYSKAKAAEGWIENCVTDADFAIF